MKRSIPLTGCIQTLYREAEGACMECGRAGDNPSCVWILRTIYALLSNYPSGVTMCVLLTDVQTRWRLQLGIGDDTDKLGVLNATGQLNPGDVIVGRIVRQPTVNADNGGCV